jgi:hypothetical protein
MIFDKYWSDNVYGFDEQLIASAGVIPSCDVAEILRQRMPGCVEVKKSCKETDRSGVDWWAVLENGKRVGVDLKNRDKDCMAFGNDDLALETWSVIGERPGWTRDESKICDWVLWVWGDTGRFFLLPFQPLCSVFGDSWQKWRADYKTRQQRTPGRNGKPGWSSECVFVPRKVVLEAVTEWFCGRVE